MMRDVTVSGKFAVASGHQVEVIILDDANHAALRTGENWTSLYSLGSTGSGTLDVPITPPEDGETRYWLTFVDLSSTEPSVLRAQAEIDLNRTQRSQANGMPFKVGYRCAHLLFSCMLPFQPRWSQGTSVQRCRLPSGHSKTS